MEHRSRASLADLYLVEGQAELINGRIIRLPGHGLRIGRTLGKLAHSLMDYEESVGIGEVFTSTLCYVVPMLQSGRESFCADVSYYVGPFPANPMDFIQGPPTFAIEIRDEVDYGYDAELAIADKRADYFEAGTLVVWDVDSVAELIHVYRSNAPDQPTTFVRGDIAEAEPAVPGWQIAVDSIFG